MTTGRRPLKPVVALIAAGIALTLCLLWIGLRQHRDTPEPRVAESSPATPTAAEAAPTVGGASAAPASAAEGGLPPVVPIPLRPILIEAENGSWLRDKDYLLAPHRAQEFGGVKFLMDGMLQLQGRASKDRDRSYRSQIVIPLTQAYLAAGGHTIPIGTNVASLHLLGGSRYEEVPGAAFAYVVWRFADGSSQNTPLQYAVHLRDWVRNPYEQPARLPNLFSKVVWTDASQPAHVLRLYRLTLANPKPEKTVDSIELDSAMTEATLFIVGVTLDPLRPGERPDPTPDLEPVDPFPPSVLQVLVQDTAGVPLSGAEIRSFARQAGANVRQLLRTDANGSALVGYAPQQLERFELSASREGYGGRRMFWDVGAGNALPPSCTLKLAAGISVGGFLMDSDGNPITGASVELYRFWSGGDDPGSRRDEVDFPRQKQITDPQGRWQAQGLPEELLSHIAFQINHRDFPGTNITVGANPTAEKELRAGTHRVVLQRGLEVRGRVVDDRDAPIGGATVWAGRRYFRDRQQTRSDDQGRFAFRNLTVGETLFSVIAASRKPESKTFNVQPGMNEIVFRLVAGAVIRARVQNESGDPLAGCRVVLEGNSLQATSDGLEFSTTTDADGRFQWDSAPDEPMPFYVYHEGYESKRNALLKPETDNVVTLRRVRQLQGQVLDAATEQPITRFSARVGHQDNTRQSDVYGVINQRQFSAADGRFTMDLGEEEYNAVAVSADGYSEKIEPFPGAQNGVEHVVVRLKQSGSLDGVVLSPEGTPAAGVTVAVVTESAGPNSVQLANARLRALGRGNIVTTDATGHFHIPSLPESGSVVAAGVVGFARVTLAQVRDSGTILLASWGRIEGTLMIGGKPGAGQELLFSFPTGGIMPDFNSYKVTVDEQGRFTMDGIPPGDGAIVRLIKTSPSSWMHSHSTPVTVLAGQTTPVALGDSGAVLNGSVRWETPPAEGESFTISGDLSTPMPRMPSFNSSEEAKAFMNSPEWKEQVKQRKSFAVAVNADGTLAIDSVPPGTYTLQLRAVKSGEQPWSQPVATGQMSVTIPDSANPLSPINIGELVLKPPPKTK